MKFQLVFNILVVVVVANVFLVPMAKGDIAEVEGVFGISEVEEMALAVWVPLNEGDIVSGVRWFNNDGSVDFPEFLAVAGNVNSPESLFDATTIAVDVQGETLNWSQLEFGQPLASSAGGVFLIWKMPVENPFVASGEGAGFGYLEGNEDNICYLTLDGEDWNGFVLSNQLAVEVMLEADKSSNVLVLDKPGSEPTGSVGRLTLEEVAIASSLRAYPNPFNPTIEISYSLPKDGNVDVSIFDIRGRKVYSLETGFKSGGNHLVTWSGQIDSGAKAPSGVYLVNVRSASIEQSIRITLTK